MAEFDRLDPDQRLRLLDELDVLDSKRRYLPWDQVRRRPPPEGLTRRTWWLGFVLARRAGRQRLPLLGKGGVPFWYCNAPPVMEGLQRVDREMTGHILLDQDIVSSADKDRYLVSSLMEEAIRSSQFEGANTTRLVAQEMLRTGRQPVNKSERMIFNNFAAMQTVERWARDDVDVTEGRLLRLYEIVTDGTLGEASDSGRLQAAGEVRVAVVAGDGSVVHEPPPAAELPERIERLCSFANGDEDNGYLHPVVRAIMCHFMIGYDHPFVDGNGRTARALFYWTMLRSGYWLAAYLSISNLLHEAPSQYSRAYEYVHADANDATYFLIHQLLMLQRAADQLRSYIARQTERASAVAQLLNQRRDLNHRQEVILDRALRRAQFEFTVIGHRTEFRVANGTARSDLMGLVKRGLFIREGNYRQYFFRPAPDLQERIGG
jgi:Fic family protein